MQVKVKGKYVRMSPQKIRLVADLIRGADVIEAENQLRFVNKQKASCFLNNILKSAVANAIHNHGMVKENLYVYNVTVDGGPMLKRWRPRAFGRAFPIRRRTSHVSLILDERVPGKRTVKEVAKVKSEIKTTEEQKTETKSGLKGKKPELKDQKKGPGQKGRFINLKNKLFSRKSG